MKKFLSLKTLAVFLILALSIVAFAACVKPNDDPPADSTPAYAIPEFSIKITDGASEYTIGKSDVANLEFTAASRTKSEVTTYYKGFALDDILALKNIVMDGIVSISLNNGDETQEDFYESDLEGGNIAACVLATVASTTEQDGYVIMTTPANSEDPEGPIRAVCMAETTEFKSVKNVVNIVISRAA